MKKHTPAPEGYYEDDADEVEDLAQDREETTLRARLRQRVVAVLGTSYGISAAVHVAILLVLATIIITSPPAEQSAELQVSRRADPPKLDEDRTPDTRDQPEVPLTEPVETPIIIKNEEVEITTDVPKGLSFDNPSDKNLESNKFDDATGLSGGASGPYGSRLGRGRLGDEGGGKATEDGVRGALEWLARHQAPDGSWRQGWKAQCKGAPCSGGAWDGDVQVHAVGTTSLALLAFLGNGNTHRFAKYEHFRRAVHKGLRWLRGQQAPNGSFGWQGNHDGAYAHAIATMAVCEALAITRDFELKQPAARAVELLLSAQNPGLGWKYGFRDGRNDSSVTGWMILALKAARSAGLEVPAEAFDGARAWFTRVTDADGVAGYETPGGGSSFLGATDGKYDEVPTNTAVSVLCRLLMGERRSADVLRRGGRHLLDAPPSWPTSDASQARGATRKVNFYYWYYGTYAMFQLGGQPWHDWNEKMKAALLPHQRRGGCEDGSWDAECPWSLTGGRVYATAINALTLEIYYRYERAKEQPALDQVAPRKR